EPVVVPEPEPVVAPEPEPEPVVVPEPEPVVAPEPEPEVAPEPEDVTEPSISEVPTGNKVSDQISPLNELHVDEDEDEKFWRELEEASREQLILPHDSHIRSETHQPEPPQEEDHEDKFWKELEEASQERLIINQSEEKKTETLVQPQRNEESEIPVSPTTPIASTLTPELGTSAARKEPLAPTNTLHDFDFDDEVEKEKASKGINIWLFIGGIVIGICIGFVIGYFLRPVISPYNDSDKTPVPVTVESVPAETAVETAHSDLIEPQTPPAGSNVEKEVSQETPTTPSTTAPPAKGFDDLKQKVVLDTVRPGRYLTTMSRAHYGGRYEFWIYIYEENKSKIGNPDNIPVGTVLVIPPREKYDINPSSPQSIEKAKEQAAKLSF
ncbi:MAG: hypothetical protein J1E99_03105, partial [Muribaculaceae bacterium]|nr:hypothetical protein [Muribaculaceae bacterium]